MPFREANLRKGSDHKEFVGTCNKRVTKNRYHPYIEGQMAIVTHKCHLSNLHDPYLILGPFFIEIKDYWPFKSIIHDFFTNREMAWIIKYSKPRLSRARRATTKEELSSNINVVTKAVQTWIDDIKYTENETLKLIRNEKGNLVYEALRLHDPYDFKIADRLLLDISQRIELVTRLNVTSRNGATKYQTTNYGLGGLCQPHLDPYGYEQGDNTLIERRSHLSRTGDKVATFMGWMNSVAKGGATAFTHNGYNELLEPRKGSAAFWINLTSCHKRDYRTKHGGCPVLKGSKWILNKWIYSWDQWKEIPCDVTPRTTLLPDHGIPSYLDA